MADDKQKLTAIPGATDGFKKALAAMRRELPELIEYHKLVAKIKREMYNAYIAEGFTEEQAIELCKGPII